MSNKLEWIISALLVSIALSAAGLTIVSAVLVRLPANYFSLRPPNVFSPTRHPVFRRITLVLKNAAGAAFIVLGIIMLIPGIPGHGLLTILLGIMLMNFPGKGRVERWLIGRPKVLDTINRLRHRHGKPPFVLEEP